MTVTTKFVNLNNNSIYRVICSYHGAGSLYPKRVYLIVLDSDGNEIYNQYATLANTLLTSLDANGANHHAYGSGHIWIGARDWYSTNVDSYAMWKGTLGTVKIYDFPITSSTELVQTPSVTGDIGSYYNPLSIVTKCSRFNCS